MTIAIMILLEISFLLSLFIGPAIDSPDDGEFET